MRLKRNSGVADDIVEYSRGRRNSWCGDVMIKYDEEHRLRRQPAGLLLSRLLKGVGIKQDLIPG